MNAEKIIKRLYNFFIWFGIFVFVGTIVELSSLHHTTEELQFIPFVLLPLGIIMAVLLLLKTGPTVRKIAIIGLWVVAIGGIGGMIVHVTGNLRVVFRGGQQMGLLQILQLAIGGRNPLLAPGTLTIGAAMILAVAYAKQMLEIKNKK
jgi:hypothetical protein